MEESQKNELVTLLIFSYNQEKYIKESVLAALNQTYSPLEIIISDDCSTDNTFEIIKETVSDYKGPHKIIINRNDKNLGLIPHFNKILKMAKGKLIVDSAGDDISLPQRVQTLYDMWSSDKNNIMALTSSAYTIDTNGKEFLFSAYEIKDNIVEDNFFTDINFHGACAAYSAKIFKKFGNINYNCHEDMLYFRRALMLGKVLFVKDKLVKYRLGGISTNENNIPKNYSDFKRIKIKELKCASETVKQLIEDCNKIVDENIKKGLIFTSKIQEKRLKFYDSNYFFEKILLLLRLIPYLLIKRKNIIKSFRFKSHHWFRMVRDLLPDSINNLFYKDNFWLKKYIENNSSNS